MKVASKKKQMREISIQCYEKNTKTVPILRQVPHFLNMEIKFNQKKKQNKNLYMFNHTN